MIDTSKERIIRVIGHKNPDTDSICSAIAYAYLKNQTEEETFQPRRLGEINRETEFVLEHFHTDPPRLSVDMRPTIRNIDVRPEPAIDKEMSVRAVWQRMMDHDIDTLCITGENGELTGMITVKDLAKANMDTFDTTVLADAETSYSNLVETTEGELVCGDPDARITTGRILIGTTPEAMIERVRPGDLVLVTNRYEVQSCAIECGAGCLVVCMGAEIPQVILNKAAEKGCTIVRTKYDTYAAARLVSMAAPVRHYMITENMVTFNINTPIAEARKVMANLRLHYFPILDKAGAYQGIISRRNLMNLHRKKVILVDHNEKSQAVDGLEEAEILEIIDHHRIGTLETGNPVFFRNEPVGCTATIIYTMFREQSVAIPPDIAGLLLSAILSDTLLFHSPTCTVFDRAAAKDLAEICGEDIEEYGNAMFEAGEELSGRKGEDLLYADYKEFAIGNYNIAVGQGFFISERAYGKAESLIREILPSVQESSRNDMILYMLTSIPKRSTLLLFSGPEAQEIVSEAFYEEATDGSLFLKDIVSRKSQLIPPLRERLLR